MRTCATYVCVCVACMHACMHCGWFRWIDLLADTLLSKKQDAFFFDDRNNRMLTPEEQQRCALQVVVCGVALCLFCFDGFACSVLCCCTCVHLFLFFVSFALSFGSFAACSFVLVSRSIP